MSQALERRGAVSDDFERLLGEALAPVCRDPDAQFVMRISARIVFEQRIAEQRGAELRTFGIQMLALVAITSGLVWLVHAAPATKLLANVPGAALAVLCAAFGLVVTIIAGQQDGTVPIGRVSSRTN
jgi:hypothetical protein